MSGEIVDSVDYFTYLGNFISTGWSVWDEISMNLKSSLVEANLQHLSRRLDIRLPNKGWVHCATDLCILTSGFLIWIKKIKHMLQLQVFDYKCLNSIAHVSRNYHVSNTEFRHRVLHINSELVYGISDLRRLNAVGTCIVYTQPPFGSLHTFSFYKGKMDEK